MHLDGPVFCLSSLHNYVLGKVQDTRRQNIV